MQVTDAKKDAYSPTRPDCNETSDIPYSPTAPAYDPKWRVISPRGEDCYSPSRPDMKRRRVEPYTPCSTPAIECDTPYSPSMPPLVTLPPYACYPSMPWIYYRGFY